MAGPAAHVSPALEDELTKLVEEVAKLLKELVGLGGPFGGGPDGGSSLLSLGSANSNSN